MDYCVEMKFGEENDMDQVEERQKDMNYFVRVAKVFVKPGEVMEQIKKRPMILFPWLGLLVIGVFLTTMSLDLLKETLVTTYMQMGMEITEGYINTMATISLVTGSLMLSAIPLITGLLSHLVSLIMGGKGNVKHSLSVVLFASYISSIGGLITVLLAKAFGLTGLTLSLGAALPNLGNPMLSNLLQYVEVFTIWSLIVMTIGFKRTHETSGGKAFAIAFIPQLIFIAISLIGVMMTPGAM